MSSTVTSRAFVERARVDDALMRNAPVLPRVEYVIGSGEPLCDVIGAQIATRVAWVRPAPPIIRQ